MSQISASDVRKICSQLALSGAALEIIAENHSAHPQPKSRNCPGTQDALSPERQGAFCTAGPFHTDLPVLAEM